MSKYSNCKYFKEKILFFLLCFCLLTICFTFYLFASVNKYEIEFTKLLENKSHIDKFKILEDSVLFSTDKHKSLYAAENYLQLAKNGDNSNLANAYRLIGRTYWLIGKLSLSQENNFKSLELFEKTNDTLGAAKTMNLIGVVFQLQKEEEKAIKYFEKAIEKFSSLNDMQGMANVLGNLSIIYRNQRKFQKAMGQIDKALDIYRKLDKMKNLPDNNSMGIALCYSYFADIYSELGNADSSKYYYQNALIIHRNINHKHGIASILLS